MGSLLSKCVGYSFPKQVEKRRNQRRKAIIKYPHTYDGTYKPPSGLTKQPHITQIQIFRGEKY